jgi:hypothetical protein
MKVKKRIDAKRLSVLVGLELVPKSDVLRELHLTRISFWRMKQRGLKTLMVKKEEFVAGSELKRFFEEQGRPKPHVRLETRRDINRRQKCSKEFTAKVLAEEYAT